MDADLAVWVWIERHRIEEPTEVSCAWMVSGGAADLAPTLVYA
jgi:hypothetical protein